MELVRFAFSGKAEDRSRVCPRSRIERLTGITFGCNRYGLNKLVAGGDVSSRRFEATIGVLNRPIVSRRKTAPTWPSRGPNMKSISSRFVNEFRVQSCEVPCPPTRIDVIHMPKNQNPDTLFGNLEDEVKQSYPLGLLSYWEQSIHDSSGVVTQVLQESDTLASLDASDVSSSDGDAEVPSDSKYSNSQTAKILRLLLEAAANSNDPDEVKFTALMSALNALQLDAIETITSQGDDGPAQALISPLKDVPLADVGNDLKASLNFRLLCTDPASQIVPGNIYRIDRLDEKVGQLFPPFGRLTFDAADPKSDKNANGLLKDASIPIAMEITPVCDYQQRKRGMPRFICGLAVPIDKTPLLKSENALFMKKTEPIAFGSPDLKGLMSLVWNSRFVVSVPEKLIEGATGLVRLRQAPLIDVQAWLGGQGNRPGYLSVQISSLPPDQSNASPAPGAVTAE